jgi:hypothetical protein
MLCRAFRSLAYAQNCPLTAINEKVVDQFILGHLSKCRYPDPVRRVDYENKAALARLLEALRVKGAIPNRLSVSDILDTSLFGSTRICAMLKAWF